MKNNKAQNSFLKALVVLTTGTLYVNGWVQKAILKRADSGSVIKAGNISN